MASQIESGHDVEEHDFDDEGSELEEVLSKYVKMMFTLYLSEHLFNIFSHLRR